MQQELLFQDIQKICGSNRMTEEQIYQNPYLTAVFHETLRKYSPAPVVPLRYAHEDTELGGYFIPAGSEVGHQLLLLLFSYKYYYLFAIVTPIDICCLDCNKHLRV